jgi:hypothetical protein
LESVHPSHGGNQYANPNEHTYSGLCARKKSKVSTSSDLSPRSHAGSYFAQSCVSSDDWNTKNSFAGASFLPTDGRTRQDLSAQAELASGSLKVPERQMLT